MKISPIVIFLIISIVSSIFNSSKKGKKNTRKDVLPGMNPLPQKLDTDARTLAKPIPAKPNVIKNLLDELDIDLSDFTEQKNEEILNEPEVIAKVAVEVTEENTLKKGRLKRLKTSVVERIKEVDVYDQKAKKAGMDLEMTPENLIHGVVMAEILQPPRARRPYRPLYLDRE